MKRKILSVILTVAMILSIIPASVLAAGAKRTTPLDLTTQETADKIADEGWAWNEETKTLTLNGLDIETDATPAVTVPAGTTIILADSSENSIITTAGSGRGIQCEGSLTIKTEDGAAIKGTLNITTGATGRGIIYRIDRTEVLTTADVVFDFSDVILNIDAQRGLENTFDPSKITDSTNFCQLSVIMTDAEFNHTASSANRAISLYNSFGSATCSVDNTAFNGIGDIYVYGTKTDSVTTVNIDDSALNITGILYARNADNNFMSIENSTVSAAEIYVGMINAHISSKLTVNNSTLVVGPQSSSYSTIEVGVNGAAASEATLKNSKIIAVATNHSALSVSRQPVEKEDGTKETSNEARGNLTIENCEMFLLDKDKDGFTHLSKATTIDSDITTATAPANTTVTVSVVDNILNLTLPVGTVIKSGGETYTTTAETTLTLDTDTQILSVPVNTTLTTANGEITTEGIMTIAPGQVISAENTFKISANISSSVDKVVVGEKIFISVNVSADGSFNAAQLEVTYPADSFTFIQADSTLNGATVTAENGVVKLVDYGEAQSYDDSVYTLVFTATRSGDAEFALVSAGFGTLESAETDDLTKADCYVISTPVTVKNNVTLDDIYGGEASVYRGDNYTFGVEKSTGAYYDYELPTATIGGVEATVIDNGNGTWTVQNVTGELVIKGTRTPKTHNATIEGENAGNDGTSATYLTDYKFTLKDNVPAGLEQGYVYTVESVTIGGKEYKGYTVDGRVHTIPGTDIIGDVVVKVKTTVLDPNKFSVTVVGNGAGAATLSTEVVDINNNVTLTVPTKDGYVYTVTAGDYAVEKNDDVYTVKNVTTAVEFNVSRVVDVAGDTGVTKAEVSQYVTLDRTVMWLVTIGNKIDGKVYTYNGQNMFWSEKYNTYATLVVSTEKPVLESADFDIVTANASEVTYDMDINMTGTVDANDAQLVWNMYNAKYSNFTDNVTLEKFLRADVNGDKKIDVEDATAIVNDILGK